MKLIIICFFISTLLMGSVTQEHKKFIDDTDLKTWVRVHGDFMAMLPLIQQTGILGSTAHDAMTLEDSSEYVKYLRLYSSASNVASLRLTYYNPLSWNMEILKDSSIDYLSLEQGGYLLKEDGYRLMLE